MAATPATAWLPHCPPFVFWSPFGYFALPFGLVFVVFLGNVFCRCWISFWLVFGVNFACFSHTCSNNVFGYFFLGVFSYACKLSKHGIFKTHCFSKVKTLFWRNRLCIRNLRISFFGGWIVPCFLLNFKFFWRFFLWYFFASIFRHIFVQKYVKNVPKT